MAPVGRACYFDRYVEQLIPSRWERPGDDPIFALNSEARARKLAGEVVINATVGALLDDEGRLATLPVVTEALREVPPATALAYAPIAGSADFLRAVTVDAFGDRAPECVAVATPGGSGALRHAVANFLERGQSLLTTSFYWGPYKTIADENERSLQAFRMFDEAGRLDVGSLYKTLGAQLESQGRALLFLNSPCHNPTGYSLDDAEWAAVAGVVGELAPRGPVTVLVDAAYAHYGARSLSSAIEAFAPLAGRVLLAVAWTASKSFTLYGGRVGALVLLIPDAQRRKRVEASLTYSSRGTWSNCNAMGMAAVARLLSEPSLAVRVAKERGELQALLARRVASWNERAPSRGVRYPRYDGGFFTTVFCDRAHERALRLKARGVFVVPQEGALRVALCSVAERDVPTLVDHLTAELG